jgi:hypothetical protein
MLHLLCVMRQRERTDRDTMMRFVRKAADCQVEMVVIDESRMLRGNYWRISQLSENAASKPVQLNFPF